MICYDFCTVITCAQSFWQNFVKVQIDASKVKGDWTVDVSWIDCDEEAGKTNIESTANEFSYAESTVSKLSPSHGHQQL